MTSSASSGGVGMAARSLRRSSSWQERYLSRWYFEKASWCDGTTKFHSVCSDLISRRAGERPRLLEIGSGPTNVTSDFLAGLGHLTGVDVDPVVRANAALDVSCVVTGEALPFEDCEFDVCVSNWVLEHMAKPETHLEEVARVLRPGGYYIARTPNRNHYVSLGAILTPHSFHKFVANRLRGLPKETHEPWPTFYRLNTFNSLRKACERAGLEIAEMRAIESEPSYGMASRLLFLAFMLYERMVNSSPRFKRLRHTFIVIMTRPEL